MTGLRASDDEMLSAYADGELSADDAAWVANRLAREPDLARKLAEFHRIKAALARLADDPAPDVPIISATPKRRFGYGAVAAAVAAVAVLGAGLLYTSHTAGSFGTKPETATVLTQKERLVASHDVWAASEGPYLTEGLQAPAWMETLLRANGLELVHSAAVHAPNAEHFGFVGKNDCRLSLFVSAAPADTAGTLLISSDGGLQTASWIDGSDGFLLVARGMDALRFNTVATSMHLAARDLRRDGDEMLATLAAARQTCNA